MSNLLHDLNYDVLAVLESKREVKSNIDGFEESIWGKDLKEKEGNGGEIGHWRWVGAEVRGKRVAFTAIVREGGKCTAIQSGAHTCSVFASRIPQ